VNEFNARSPCNRLYGTYTYAGVLQLLFVCSLITVVALVMWDLTVAPSVVLVVSLKSILSV